MKKFLMIFCSALGGAAVGSIATYTIVTHQSVKDAIKKAIDSIDIFASKKKIEEAYLRGYNDCMNETRNDDIYKNSTKDYSKKEEEDSNDILLKSSSSIIKEKLSRNLDSTTNYASIYSKKKEENEEMDEKEPTVDEDSIEEEYFDTHQKVKNRPPKIISEESLGDIPEYYDSETLFYYAEDDVLATESEEAIDDPERLVGDCLTKYNFKENDEERIFVRNWSLDTVYEIQKIRGWFADTKF